VNDVEYKEVADTKHQTEMTADELCHDEAAIKIRAGVRGFLARHEVKALRCDIFQLFISSFLQCNELLQ